MPRLSQEELDDMVADGAKIAVRPRPLEPTVLAQQALTEKIGQVVEASAVQMDLSLRIAEELARMNLKVPSQIRAKVTKRDEDGRIDVVEMSVVK